MDGGHSAGGGTEVEAKPTHRSVTLRQPNPNSDPVDLEPATWDNPFAQKRKPVCKAKQPWVTKGDCLRRELRDYPVLGRRIGEKGKIQSDQNKDNPPPPPPLK